MILYLKICIPVLIPVWFFALIQDEMVKASMDAIDPDDDEPLDQLEAGEDGEEEDAEDDSVLDSWLGHPNKIKQVKSYM